MPINPTIYKLPKPSRDIFSVDAEPVFSQSLDYPEFRYGFHHYLHQTKDKTGAAFGRFEGKKKVYYIMNKYERKVDNYDSDIDSVSKAYFDIDPKPDIMSRAFFKLWELLFNFDLVPLDKSGFVSAHLAEGPGSFIQATMFFRDKYSKNSKKDKYHAVTLHSERPTVPPLEKSFISHYKRESPQRFILHETHTKDIAKMSGGALDNGDLTDPLTMEHFGGAVKLSGDADLVTADGGFDWQNENVQEQEAFKLILAEIVMALKVQKKGGNFVCKFFETFTDTSAKMLYILTTFYSEVYVVKPLMSRSSNSERYAVCMGFKGSSKNIKVLEKLVAEGHKNKDKMLTRIFPKFKLPSEFEMTLTQANIEIANRQFITINKMITFIEQENYFGDVYQQNRNNQIEASKLWTSTYYPKKYEDGKKNVKKIVDNLIKDSQENVETLKEKMNQGRK